MFLSKSQQRLHQHQCLLNDHAERGKSILVLVVCVGSVPITIIPLCFTPSRCRYSKLRHKHLKQALVSIFLHCKVVKKQEYYEKSGGKASAEKVPLCKKDRGVWVFWVCFLPIESTHTMALNDETMIKTMMAPAACSCSNYQ